MGMEVVRLRNIRLLLYFLLCQGHYQMSLARELVLPFVLKNNITDSTINMLIHLNPAAISLIPVEKHITVSASYTSLKCNQLHYSFEGDKRVAYNGRVTGFKQSKSHTVAGIAGYSKGTDFHLKWTDVSDNPKIGPYRLADTTGGNRHFEIYNVGGTVSMKTRYGYIGLLGNYRAESAHRTHDPRSSTTISEPEAAVGFMVNSAEYAIGVSLRISHYSQFVNVKNVRSDRKDMFYFLYGFGNYNDLISGSNSYYSVDYSGLCYNATFFMLPDQGKNGWFTDTKFKAGTVKANLDETTPGVFRTCVLSSTTGYQWRANTHPLFLGIQFSHGNGKGTEQYYETIIVDEETNLTDTRLLSKGQKYHQQHSSVALVFNSTSGQDNILFTSNCKTGLNHHEIKYKTTSYGQEVNKWFTDISGHLQKTFNKTVAGILVYAGYSHCLSSWIRTPNDNRICEEQVIPDFRYLSANLFKTGMQIHSDLPLFREKNTDAALSASLIKSSSDHAFQYSFQITFHL